MNPRSFAVLAVLLMSVGGTSQPTSAQDKFNRAPPFQGVRWVPEVRIDGRWYQLRAIDGVSTQEVIDFIARQEGDRWPRRFAEDLVEMLAKAGHPPGETVTLSVRDVETGADKTLDRVPLTKANRDAIRAFMDDLRVKSLPPLRPEAMHGALDDLRVALDERWSYRHANPADFPAAIAALRTRVDAGLTAEEFGVELRKVIALGIDGHAGVSGVRPPRGAFLPFRVAGEGERVIALDGARRAFLADGFPYLTKIDGKAVADWCSAAAVLVPKGSPQYVRARCLRHLEELDAARALMGLPKTGTVEVEVASADGGASKTLTLPVGKSQLTAEAWPPGGSRVLEGDVGYLRLGDMGRTASVPEIRTWMPKFAATKGLVVDVRGNTGGHRDALVLLYSYLAAPAAPPRVVSAAAYRLHPAHKATHLVERFMYPADASEWTPAERRAVAAFAKTFRPRWDLPAGRFSDWHYLVLRRSDDKDVFHYPRPVAVLTDARCFSATDVFLAGLKGMRNVTLVGTPSGGGSALVQEVPLGATPFRLRIGSMASFQADGRLFDGHGVQPDVVVEPVPEYYIGGRDNVLEEAVRRASRP